jgi:D-aspartate ligase
MDSSPALDRTYPALILKASRRTIHHGALGVARSLGRRGVPVYAVVEDGYSPLAASRYVIKNFVWKSWPSDREAFLAAMSAIGKIIDHPTILIPIDDLSAVTVAENATALSKWYICPQLPAALPRRLANKAIFYSMCAEIGIPVAQNIVPHSIDDVREFVKNTTFPIVVKAAEQWRPMNNRFNVKVIRTPEVLFGFCKDVGFAEFSPMILQEYISGNDWIYHGYSNFKERLYLSFTGKKLMDYPPGSGSTALGMSSRNELLLSQSEGLLRALSYSGIIDIDWRQDERDGQYKIMDCNPRIGMNFRMFENDAAIDVVRAQHLNLTGRSVSCTPMIENRLLIVESYCLLSFMRGGRIAVAIGTDRHPRFANREFAWWSRDDALPFLIMSARLIVQTVKRTLRHMWNYIWGEH